MNFKRLAALYIAVFSALPLSQACARVAKYNRWAHAEINVCFAEKEMELILDIFNDKHPFRLRHYLLV